MILWHNKILMVYLVVIMIEIFKKYFLFFFPLVSLFINVSFFVHCYFVRLMNFEFLLIRLLVLNY